MKAITTKRFFGDESGAVAATYALALIPLIAFAGVGFDYARVMGLDSELQNGADQAALAAASQLDGRTGACARAADAAAGMLQNVAILSSESKLVTVTSEIACDGTGQIRFYQDKAKTNAATTDSNANYVEVQVDGRRMNYSLLPIVGTYGADLAGVAFAGLGSAICKVPPVMMCNPNESSDPDFNTSLYVGNGLRLIANEQGGLYGPGVFGYLETNAGNGAIATARTLGREVPPGDCVTTDGADVKPGQQISVLDALNTRVGVYANGLNNVCGTNDASCPPPANARIDLLRRGGQCSIGNSGFQVGPAPYRPTSPTADYSTYGNVAALDPMGFPRDKCHAVSVSGSCTQGTMGDGNWDRAAFYQSNGLGSMPTTWSSYGYSELAGRSTPTRYQQYRWEYEQHVAGGGQLTNVNVPGGYETQRTPLCNPPGLPPASTPDRRVLSIAIINCNAEAVGSNTTDAAILKFIDVFLVEPSARRGNGSTLRTEASDVYVEVIGETILGGGSQQGQEVRKDVPYLIE